MSIRTSLATIRALTASMIGGSANTALPMSKTTTKRHIRYNFRDMMHKASATKKYVNGKLRRFQKECYPQKRETSGRGALGARERVVGVHWRKAGV